MSFKLIIFDCDGVLIDSELISARMLIETLAEKGVNVSLGYVTQNFLGRSYPIVMKQIRAEFGVTLSAEFETIYRERLLKRFESELRATPGIHEAISDLTIPSCLATSSSKPRVTASLKMVGLLDSFEGRIFTASEVDRGKPEPDLFLHAANKMGVAPKDCLVIEDSRNGILAGLAAGMNVWWFNGGSHIDPGEKNGPLAKMTDRAFDDFSGFSEAIRRSDWQET